MSFEGQTFSELFLQASRKLVNTDNFTTCWNLQNNLTHGQYKCRTISRLSELTSTPPIQFLKGTKDIILKKNSKHILASMIYFDSDMSKSTNTVVYVDWKTVIYIYACRKCRTQFM